MILHRFMSESEYKKLVAGETLENHARHDAHTSSIGFCFTPSPPEESIHWLSGNVDTDVCVTMAVPDTMVAPCEARYRDIRKPMPGTLPAEDMATVTRKEYCCERYSIRDVRVLGVTTAFSRIPGRKETDALLRMMGYERKQDNTRL